jgi:hypothetical protein
MRSGQPPALRSRRCRRRNSLELDEARSDVDGVAPRRSVRAPGRRPCPASTAASLWRILLRWTGSSGSPRSANGFATRPTDGERAPLGCPDRLNTGLSAAGRFVGRNLRLCSPTRLQTIRKERGTADCPRCRSKGSRDGRHRFRRSSQSRSGNTKRLRSQTSTWCGSIQTNRGVIHGPHGVADPSTAYFLWLSPNKRSNAHFGYYQVAPLRPGARTGHQVAAAG